ncbi:CAAX prenyl protease 1, putative [Lunatimonas lonarensis]|uniref:CAAX prenyl protease 1, putative n=1 Tax=Lunatimonas lonarensis TaxID=1232681 RepID=R7ZS34_9BACT|nr:M48 family metallopeptidase [Lunatimonas lonarensis]EON76897.1 CAAX prenyl protease 1, putative [Lunatimonas lonarensis]
MDPNTITYLLIGILSVNFISSKFLNWLNIRRKENGIPKTMEGYLDTEKLTKANEYQRVNFNFSLVASFFSFGLTILFLASGFFGWLDAFLSQFTIHPLWLPALYFAVLYLGSDLMGIPFDYYHTFVIEQRFGFNNTSMGTFLSDKLKGYLLSIVIGGSLLLTFLLLVNYMGVDFWWQFWLVTGVFMVLVNGLFSSYILPLFNKLTPLEEGELRQAILSYASKAGFPLENVFVIDGSKRSSKANAFFSGFGKRKKVVLYDTLIAQHSTDELVAVLAHEIGHYKKRHIVTNLVLGILQTGLILFVLAQLIFSESLSLALGGSEMAVHLNLVGFTMLFSPLSALIGVGMNILSRKHEFEADAFAKSTFDGQPLATALKKLSVNNLTNLNPHPWYVFMNYSHPPLLQRLAKLETTG